MCTHTHTHTHTHPPSEHSTKARVQRVGNTQPYLEPTQRHIRRTCAHRRIHLKWSAGAFSFIYLCMYMYMYLYIHMYMCARVCVGVCLCVRACVCVCVCVCQLAFVARKPHRQQATSSTTSSTLMCTGCF